MTATATHEERAIEFATAVRERLADLPADELDDLLDGLESDLAERLADGGEVGDLGDPGDYAAELRQAAGLPVRETLVRHRRGTGEAIRQFGITAATKHRAFWEATPVRRGLRDFATSLRPAWWVLRALVGVWVVLGVTGLSSSSAYGIVPPALVAVLLVTVSVQWGRGLWQPQRWIVWLRRVANTLAVVLVVPALLWVTNSFSAPYVDDYQDHAMTGLVHDGGEAITNIFAYDCAGNPLDGVQLFDDQGKPLTTLQAGEPATVWNEAGYDEDLQSGGETLLQRNPLALLSNGWNVFPLSQAEYDYAQVLGPIEPAEAPFSEVPALSEECPAPAGTAKDDSAASVDTRGDAKAASASKAPF